LRPDIIYMEGFRRVEELGGVVRQNEPVIGGVFDSRGELIGVRTGRGEEVHADLFIDATNAWSPRLCEALGAEVLEISALKRYLYFLQRGPSLTPDQLRDMPMTITPRRAYCRPENEEQLLLGWAHDSTAVDNFDWADQDVIEPEFFHKSGLENYGMELWMELADSMPPLMEFDGLRATTAGFYAVTPDHNPFLGFNPRQPRLLHAVGFSGHGAMMGPFTAAATTEMALAGETLHSIDVGGRTISLAALRIGRVSHQSEGMVI
jgi:sarcosine oxidase, subunit beta